ncbi:DNA internalization-related competence protein ComEC/Rec2 [Bacillaceae bacterium W0354]
MRGHWYIVALFYCIGYLPTVIGFLIVVILTFLLNLLRNRLLLTLSFFFYIISSVFSPTLSQNEQISQFDLNLNDRVLVTSDPVRKSDYVELIGQVENSNKKILIRLNEDNHSSAIRHGAICNIEAELKIPNEPTNIGQFNYREFLSSKGIFFETKRVTIKDCEGRSLLSYLYEFRHQWQERAKKALLAESFQWVNAIIFGDRALLDKKITDTFQFWNISHLLAISGLHVGLTLAILYLIFQKVFKLSRETTQLLILLIIPFYIIIAAANPPVVRAGLMAMLLIIWQLFKIKLDPVDLISIIFIALLIFDSYLIYQLSFQFSFAVTLALILSTNLLKQNHWLLLSIKVSIISQLAILPLQFEYFYYTNIFSFVMNLIFVPYFTIFVIPICLILLISIPLSPITSLFETIFLTVNDRMMEFIVAIGQPQWTLWVFGQPTLTVIVLFYILFIMFMKYWDLQMIRRASLFATLSIFVFIVQQFYPYLDSTYSITMLDVGQSESIVIELPYRKGVFLIDAGEEVKFNQAQTEKANFKNIIKPFLWSKGISKIDAIFISHFDYDHSGAMNEVITHFNPEYVFTHPFTTLNIDKNIKLYEGMKITLNEANIDVLSPQRHKVASSENDQSLVFLLEVNDFKVLFSGDISKEVEEKIVSKTKELSVDVLKVAHHGSNTSTGEHFLRHIDPKYAMISVGRRNIYQHPHQQVLDNLSEYGVNYYRTDKNGSIIFQIKDGQLTIKTFKP